MIYKSILFFFLILCSLGCSTSTWVVKNQYETDRNDFELIDTKQYLNRVGTITPNNPIVQFELLSVNDFNYTQRVRSDRYIQRYKPRFSRVLLGLVGAGLAWYAATEAQEISTKNYLYGVAGLISLTSLLNMKPSGIPTPTGESRLLRKSGTINEKDTVRASQLAGTTVSYTMYYDGKIVAVGEDIEYRNNRYTVNLLESFNPEKTEFNTNDVITLELYFNDDRYVNTIPVTSFLEQFVVVKAPITALRDEPLLDSRSILTDLAQGSQLKFVSQEESWYKVLYGISETYIAKIDAELIWRPSEFTSQLSIITVPNIPFGNIDVETNIPRIKERTENAYAFSIANREYQGSYSERSFAERDAQLLNEYLIQAYGYNPSNVRTTTNIENEQQLVLAYNRLANEFRQIQEKLVVYVSGYVVQGSDNEILLVGTGGALSSTINLNSFLEEISKLQVKELILLLDIDNVENKETKLVEPLAQKILVNNPNTAIIVSSTESQRSRNYSSSGGEQKRHSIFSYYIADGIKKGGSTISEILNHLQRNVDYTSRRLHDQPQHILFFGNSKLSFIH